MTGRYKVITLCGSTRFEEQFFEAQDGLAALKARQEDILALEQYLTTSWQDDYEADERGAISKAVDRSVLGQDSLYNLLEEIDELNKE